LRGKGARYMEFFGPILWLLVVGGGTVILGLAIVYGMSRNSTRTPAEKRLTEASTRAEYRAEERDAS
jgi:hypothetical protein